MSSGFVERVTNLRCGDWNVLLRGDVVAKYTVGVGIYHR